MIFKKQRTLPLLLSSVAALTTLNACGKKAENSDLDIVGGRRVTAQDSGPEKISTVGLNGCTGTIIAKDLILTAAHCYDNSVQGGYVLFGIQFNGRDRKIINIEKATVNRAYTDPHNDVAMLKLASDIPAGYKPAKLLPAGVSLTNGQTVRQAGYGSDNTPNSFGTLRTVDSRYVGQGSRGSLSVRNGSTAACSGDSGGPLYVQQNGEWYVAGIASTAYMDAQRRCVGGNEYASVSQNYSMILDMARQLTGRQDPLGSGNEAPKPDPDDLNDPTKPAKFQLLGELTEQGDRLVIQAKNISGRAVRNCEFTLTPIRSFYGFYRVSYDLTFRVSESAADQVLNLTFQDPYANDSRLGEIEEYSVKKTCQE
ncbi:S1 family peptidase [Oligoflexus tunisiensis]|uniref:S1 family peptidase n=1 Tax=Oligoflexus tunisiensis TaxID=708132 RepID=UPI00114CDE2C|nr:trypsin-like serine protease [Oligoflexus tunisiensis]